jgi:uncharacterized SAM-binding protein YcdF (DUF218 family)
MNYGIRISTTVWLLLPTTVCMLLMMWALPSVLIVKKVIGLLVLPTGWVWLGLNAATAWPGLRRRGRLFAVLLLVGYTAAGNVWIGGELLKRLEAPYVAWSPPTEPFDAICVLGGGSSVTPSGVAQLGPAGDRLIVPARLFLAGKTRHLVASGQSVTDVGGSRSLAEGTASLWHQLGIPESAIIRLPAPRNTAEEVRAYRQLAVSHGWQRVGVCSSAWHLPRVEQFCRKEGVNLIPIPADFLSTSVPWTPLYAVPQARGFQTVQKALWEMLGSLAGG